VYRPTCRREVRRAAINASTVFAITLAIIAGLIFAYVFKVVLLDRKPKQAVAAAPVRTMTVAAVNVPDKTEIQAAHLKTVTVDEATYQKWENEAKAKGTQLLRGNQPVGRVTLTTVKAEEPIMENQLEELRYPRPVSELLPPGKVAVIIPLKPYEAMIQVGDRVDVIATLSSDNELFGLGSTASAVIVKNAPVVARFNTTRPGAQPRPGAPTWDYTLAVSPYRYKVIEMAKKVQAAFSLQVVKRAEEGDGIVSASAAPEEADPDVDRLTSGDLARLFGITPAEAERIWEIQRFSGLNQKPSWYYNMPRPAAPPESPGPIAPAGGSPGGKTKPAALPSGRVSGNGNGTPVRGTGWSRINGNGGPAAAPARSGTLVASAGPTAGLGSGGNNFGFRAPGPKAKC